MRTVTQKKEGIQHIQARLGDSLKKKWENKGMRGIVSVGRQLTNEEDTSCGC